MVAAELRVRVRLFDNSGKFRANVASLIREWLSRQVEVQDWLKYSIIVFLNDKSNL